MPDIRTLCAALAAVVVFDAAWVRAPGLALLAVPFILGAIFLRKPSTVAMVVLTLFAALFAFVGTSYAVANGFHVPAGDFVFAYIGTPVAVLLGARAVLSMKRPVGP